MIPATFKLDAHNGSLVYKLSVSGVVTFAKGSGNSTIKTSKNSITLEGNDINCDIIMTITGSITFDEQDLLNQTQPEKDENDQENAYFKELDEQDYENNYKPFLQDADFSSENFTDLRSLHNDINNIVKVENGIHSQYVVKHNVRRKPAIRAPHNLKKTIKSGGSIKCDTCGFSSLRWPSFLRHMKYHEQGKVIPLRKSRDHFENEKQMRINGTFSCLFCKSVFFHGGRLQRHLALKHSKESIYACHMCDFCCKDQYSIDKHVGLHIQGETLVCFKCNTNFSSPDDLAEHTFHFHYNGTAISCPLCLKQLKFPSHLKSHYLESHIKVLPNFAFRCGICNSHTARDHRDLLTHYYQKHCKDGRPFLCSTCGASFASKKALVAHHVIHSSDKPFSCDECSYKCKTKGQLNNHKHNAHSEDRPFQCCHCGLALKNAYNLKCHIKFKHENARPFKCPLCDYASKTKQDLIFHQQRKHSSAKPYACPHCNFVAKTKSNRNRHVTRNHSDRKPIVCHLCSFSCIYQGEMNKHMNRKHYQNKPRIIKCTECDFTTEWADALRLHCTHWHTYQVR